MKKFFNTAGPVNPNKHYSIDPSARWDLEEVMFLIEQEKYFVLHAPRQTGKTSSLLALQQHLNNSGEYFSVYVNVEAGQTARENFLLANQVIIDSIHFHLKEIQHPEINVYHREAGERPSERFKGPLGIVEYMSFLCGCFSLPVVLLLDEVDALVGDSLVSVLRQIRTLYAKKGVGVAPASIVLCGVRETKDYRLEFGGKELVGGGSAFNILSRSLRLGNFSFEEMKSLLLQHTEATGQSFEEGSFEVFWEYTRGQPWLVNALAFHLTFEMKENRDRSRLLTVEAMKEAREYLIKSRQTHLDQLAAKLKEKRVSRVIKSMIMGVTSRVEEDDREYCYDLGLIDRTPEGLQVSNPIYQEVILRELGKEQQENFLAEYRPTWIKEDGTLDENHLFSLLQDFWRENSDILASHIPGYQEAAPHLVTQAFLQRVANGNGYINREYSLGRKRLDLMLMWPYQKEGKKQEQRVIVEIKVYRQRNNFEKLKELALEQTAEYALLGNERKAHLLIFDQDNQKGWGEKVYREVTRHNGVEITIWGM